MIEQPTPRDFAEAAAEAIRSLNHATLWTPGYEYPSDVDSVLAELSTMARRLPQALRQAQEFMVLGEQAGSVGSDDDRPALAILEDVRTHLDDADSWAEALARSLDEAHQLTSHLTRTAAELGTPGWDR